jgi:hypothetical protein
MLMKHTVNWILKKEFSSRIIYFMDFSLLSLLKNKNTLYFADGIRAHREAKNMANAYSAEPDW